MASPSIPGDEPPAFAHALESLRGARLRAEVRLTEVPAPQRIAPYAAALTADVVSSAGDDDELSSGRFVLLHDPAAPEPWEGTWRVVTFARAELEPELSTDPMLGSVGWSWLMDALQATGAEHVAAAGTVTRVVSESFAGLADREPGVEMEVRASWTPVGGDIADHLEGWTELLCTIAGLPPLPEGVVALPAQRR